MKMISIKIFALLLSAFGLQCVIACPPDPSAIAPCTCEGATIRCTTTSNFDLDIVMQNLIKSTGGWKNWDTFELSSTVMTKLDADVFNGVTFRVIDIKNGPALDCISPRAFSGMELYTTTFKSVDAKMSLQSDDCNVFTALSGLSILQTVSITGSAIDKIPPKAFKGRAGPLLYLNSIDLSGDGKQGGVIKSVGGKAFSELKALTFIGLENHKIDTIDPFAFTFDDPWLGLLLTIDLGGNPLVGTSFGASAFDTNERKTTLILSSIPKLDYLDEGVFHSYLDNKPPVLDNVIELKGTPLSNNEKNEWLIESMATLNLQNKLLNVRSSIDGQSLWDHHKADFTPAPHNVVYHKYSNLYEN